MWRVKCVHWSLERALERGNSSSHLSPTLVPSQQIPTRKPSWNSPAPLHWSPSPVLIPAATAPPPATQQCWCWGPSRDILRTQPQARGGCCLDSGSKYGLWSLVPSSGWDAGSIGLAADVDVRNSWCGKKGEEESLECQLRITRGLG